MSCANSDIVLSDEMIVSCYFSEEIIGSRFTSIEAAEQIHVCNPTAVITGEVVMIHSYNVSKSISSCSCAVRLPTGTDKIPIHYTILGKESQNCGIKFRLDRDTDFSCEPKSVNRTSLRRIQFSRDRNANANASLQIRVGKSFNLYLFIPRRRRRI